jgi:hypothetical protein
MSKIEQYTPHAHFSVAAATVLLVVVGIWGVIETKSALEATQRAWIVPLGAQLSSQLETDQGVRFATILSNVGREPATAINYRFKTSTIDAYNPQFTSMYDVVIPENTSCNGLEPIEARSILPPSTTLIPGVAFNFDTRHAEPPFLVDNRILNGNKFLVITGCDAVPRCDQIGGDAAHLGSAAETAGEVKFGRDWHA